MSGCDFLQHYCPGQNGSNSCAEIQVPVIAASLHRLATISFCSTVQNDVRGMRQSRNEPCSNSFSCGVFLLSNVWHYWMRCAASILKLPPSSVEHAARY